MRHLVIALAIAAACVVAARAQIWIMSPASQMQAHGSGTPPPSSCSSGSLMNGVFDLTNTCNDIYFIGGLK